MDISIVLKEHSYQVAIENGIIDRIGNCFIKYKNGLIVTDDNVPKIYAQKVKDQTGFDIVTIPSGEENKNYNSVIKILDSMCEKKLNRSSCLISVGGGVVGDISGFCASIYMRGIDFYNIPSTFLSMVDSSVGGKTGIDYNGIKNLVGSFYQPKGVFVDPYLLKTLPERQIKSGICESYKMAACFDPSLFEKMTKGISEDDYFDIITKSIELKKDVVEKDEKESNLRRVLNFGHTLGHGIEEACNHSLYHGECVGLGMIAITKGDVQKEIISGLEKMGLPTKAHFDKDKAIENILHDKKGTNDGIVCVELNEIGKFSFGILDLNKIDEMLDYVLLR